MEASLVTDTFAIDTVTLTITSRTTGGLASGGYAKFPDGYSCAWAVIGGAVHLYKGGNGERLTSPKRLNPIVTALAQPGADKPVCADAAFRVGAVSTLLRNISDLTTLIGAAEARRDFVAGNLLRDIRSAAERAVEMLG